MTAQQHETTERFAAIVARGGLVVAAPDVYAALMRWSRATGVSLGGVDVRSCEWVQPGMIVGIALRVGVPMRPETVAIDDPGHVATVDPAVYPELVE